MVHQHGGAPVTTPIAGKTQVIAVPGKPPVRKGAWYARLWIAFCAEQEREMKRYLREAKQQNATHAREKARWRERERAAQRYRRHQRRRHPLRTLAAPIRGMVFPLALVALFLDAHHKHHGH